MADFYANFFFLQQDSKELQTQINKYKELEKRIELLLARMASSWEGDACNSYMNMMTMYLSRINKMIEVLTSYKSYIDKSMTIIDEKDRMLGDLIRNSFDGGKYEAFHSGISLF